MKALFALAIAEAIATNPALCAERLLQFHEEDVYQTAKEDLPGPLTRRIE